LNCRTWTLPRASTASRSIGRCRGWPACTRRKRDRNFFRERVFAECELWGAFGDAGMTGMIAFRKDWIDQLYVLPEAQGRGIGSALLRRAQTSFERLQLWTFQRNRSARRFYEARGFTLVRETDGSGNEEKEPDVLYLWAR